MKELSFNNKHVEEAENIDFFWIYKKKIARSVWHVHSFVYARSVILTVYYVKSNHNTDVDFAKC